MWSGGLPKYYQAVNSTWSDVSDITPVMKQFFTWKLNINSWKSTQSGFIVFLKLCMSSWTNLQENLFLQVKWAYLISNLIYKLISILVNFLTKPTLQTHPLPAKKKGGGGEGSDAVSWERLVLNVSNEAAIHVVPICISQNTSHLFLTLSSAEEVRSGTYIH